MSLYCPNCGREPTFHAYGTWQWTTYRLGCRRCGLWSYGSTVKHALWEWENARPDP